VDQIVAIVLPVFGLIGIGYGVAWSRLLSAENGDALADFVFTVPIPLLIFRTVIEADLSGASPWRLWLPFFAAFAFNWVAGDWVVRRLFGRDARAGLVAGISSAYGNTVLIGIPLAVAAYGRVGAAPMALIVAVHLPVMMTVSAVLIDHALTRDGIAEGHVSARMMARSVIRNLARNPIILGMVAGALWRIAGLPLSGVPAAIVERLADVASTLALFSMGMSLRKFGIGRNVAAGLVLSVLKLLVMPGVVLLLAWYVIPMPPIWAKIAVLASACPTGVNAYLVAARFRTGEALASNAITLSTGLAVISVSLWLHVMEWL
jgi:malonate transporter